ncbi:hypothetical protein [Gemelliphila palaticanis]|uniref:Lipoprotein n=1 Tax=Gemelliphila palaticanis TaxID=81950 RepID=A0ABX2T1T0_9BACL|nr:hypothetical protein [Gemella palaticanis]MBF0716206.1 hypothetical protein [Gemella palaticanis]NYS48136.1 hypothetical protein [Gemella palaticanis]
MNNRNIKFISILFLGLAVLNGCNNNQSANNPTSSNVSSSKEDKKEKVENKQHNKEEAKKLVNDIISFQVNSFDIQKSQFERSIPSGFATLPSLSKNVRKINIGNTGIISIINLSEVVDVYNTYNKNTYNEEDVLKDITDLLKVNDLVTYSELEEKSSDKSDDELKKILEKMGTVIYFKGDKKFAYNIPFGLGGAGMPEAAPESDWIEDGDTLEIPMISPVDKTIVNRMVVKINNKDYSGGSKKSYYYYYDVK